MTTLLIASSVEPYPRASQLVDIGYIAAGQHHPPLHPLRHIRLPMPRRPGTTTRPYWQWTAKVDGKTVTRRLSQTEAHLYLQWIDNDRQLRALIERMREVATKATELVMKEAGSTQVKVETQD